MAVARRVGGLAGPLDNGLGSPPSGASDTLLVPTPGGIAPDPTLVAGLVDVDPATQRVGTGPRRIVAAHQAQQGWQELISEPQPPLTIGS